MYNSCMSTFVQLCMSTYICTTPCMYNFLYIPCLMPTSRKLLYMMAYNLHTHVCLHITTSCMYATSVLFDGAFFIQNSFLACITSSTEYKHACRQTSLVTTYMQMELLTQFLPRVHPYIHTYIRTYIHTHMHHSYINACMRT